MTDEHTPLREQVDRSGHAFTMAVAAVIRSSSSRQQWKCISIEAPWSSKHGEGSGFIDVIIERDQAVGIIECKKVNNEERLVFLLERGQTARESRCRLEVYVQELPEGDERALASLESRFTVIDCTMPTVSPESGYCVAPKNRQNLNLDDIASDLLASCEGFLGNWDVILPDAVAVAIPIIVTNARLFTCAFDAETMDLGTGDVPQGTTFEQHSFIRFRKAFGGERSMTRPEKLGLSEVAAEEQRTVFVVDSRELIPFLAGFRRLMMPHPDGTRELVSG